MSSLFGSKSGLPSLGLFGSSSQPSSQPATSQSSGPSTLFGGLGISQATSAAASSAPTTTAVASAPQSGFSSLSQPDKSVRFDLPGATTAAGSNSNWGASQNTSTQQQTQSVFGASQNAPAGQSSIQGPSAYFNSLLEKNRKRARGLDDDSGLGDVPSLRLSLGDISKRVKELGGGGAQAKRDQAANTKAHYLLAASGVNPGTTIRDLNAFNSHLPTSQTAPLPPEWDPDSHKYVEQLQQQMTLKMISDGIDRAQRNFDNYIQEHVDINWDAQRKKVYEHFGLANRRPDESLGVGDSASPGDTGSFGRSSRRGRGLAGNKSGQGSPGRSVFGHSGMQKSVIGTPAVGAGNIQIFGETPSKAAAPLVQEDRLLRERQAKFAEKVQKLNESRLREVFYPVLKEFLSVEAQPGDSPSQLSDAYKALIEIVSENSPDNPKPRKFAEEYLDENPSSANSFKARQRILNGSRKALENQFFDHVVSYINRNIRDANVGGLPTRLNKVRAYIRVRAARKDLVPDGVELQKMNEDYCWALVFFMLRCGFVEEAAEYVMENATAFRALDRMFVTYITSFANSPERRLSQQQHNKINNEYQQRMRMAPENSLDPYRMACYKIIGRCELSKRSIDGISQGVEDWIWLQFCLARETNRAEELATDVFGLAEVQATIREIGQRHFSKGTDGTGGFGTFFYLQILGGLFEQAVAYLYSHAYVPAVHFAIALDFYGLLRVSDFSASETELLTYTTKELPQINFGRMIGYYTRDFRAGNVIAATDYLTLLYLNSDLGGQLGKAQASLCHEALRELVLETRDFAQLLGDIRADGTRVKGAIEKRLKLIGLADQEDYLRAVTLQAASVADDAGRTTDAVLLFHLAEDYDSVVAIINRALADALAVDLGAERLQLQPLKPREEVDDVKRYANDDSTLSLAGVDSPFVLARHFVTLYDSNALYYQKIRDVNREVCGLLLRLGQAKQSLEEGIWASTLDILASINIIPIDANGSVPVIRRMANNLASASPLISRLVGPMLLWAMAAISRVRDDAAGMGAGDGTDRRPPAFESGARRGIRQHCAVQATDLMVFAGLIKLRLSYGVWEAVVQGAGEISAA